MKIVSLLAAATVAVAIALVGCSDGPGTAPDESPMTPEPPKKQEFTGTFIATPDTNPLMGSMTATITGISHDDMPLEGPGLAATLAELGATQTFMYEVSIDPAMDITVITLTGELLTKQTPPIPMVMVQKTGAVAATNLLALLAALPGTWTATVPDPATMATIAEITLVIENDPAGPPRFGFMLTLDTTSAPSG